MTAKKKVKISKNQSDGPYLLKLVLYVIVGSQWVWFTNEAGGIAVTLPVGLIIGLLFARHEHFRLDRKIEYALLLVAMLIGFWSQVGIFINI